MGIIKKVAGRNPEQVEMDRILALPIRSEPDPEQVEIESFERINVEAFTRGDRLLPKQVDALMQFEACRGAFCPVGVGFGKSGIGLMVSQIAVHKGWARKILLLVPVHLIDGLVQRHIPEWRKRTNLSLTFHVISGKTKAQRMKIATSDAAGVYIFPYSLMSQLDTLDLLAAINPDMVVADEAHRLKNLRSAVTKKLMHVIKNTREQPLIFVAMSGSMSSKGIMEYQHLIDMALGDGSPLPRKAGQAFTWGLVIDANAAPTPSLVAGAMGRLISWAHEKFPEDRKQFSNRIGVDNARNAYRKRLTLTPGVVVSGDERPTASLAIANYEAGGHGIRLSALMAKAKEDYETPEGEPIDHAIHVYKWLRELTAGFYNSRVWPQAEDHAKNRKISKDEAVDRIERAKVHLKAHQIYTAGAREFFKESPIGIDTPTELALAISRGACSDSSLVDKWHAVHAADFEGRPDRIQIPVRVDPYKVQAVVRWAQEYKTGLVWVYHKELGEWIYEVLTDAGHDPVFAPAGADAVIEGIGDPGRGGKGDRLVVSSIPAHGEGRNLQSFQNQLFVEWPRPAHLAEQALGRVHRTGQTLEEVMVHTMIETEFDEINRAATLADAVYVQQTMGSVHRVLYADYAEMPKIFDPRMLKARGAAPLSTDPNLWAKIRERFGG